MSARAGQGGGVTIRGVVGQVNWSYAVAAALQNYTVTRDKPTHAWTLRAQVVSADRFRLSQRPLMFVAPTAKGDWRWPILDWTMVASVFTARLGPPDEGRV